jgi:hypothetical protein
VNADKIYRNRKNRKFCKRHGIRLSGPVLGRPPKEVDPEHKQQAHQDESDRILIKGKFGRRKRRFSLSKIMCKLARTLETAILFVFFAGAGISPITLWRPYNTDEAISMR